MRRSGVRRGGGDERQESYARSRRNVIGRGAVAAEMARVCGLAEAGATGIGHDERNSARWWRAGHRHAEYGIR